MCNLYTVSVSATYTLIYFLINRDIFDIIQKQKSLFIPNTDSEDSYHVNVDMFQYDQIECRLCDNKLQCKTYIIELNE